MPGTSWLRNDLVFSTLSAPSAPGSYTFMRIAACGHTTAHLPQSMHRSDSQIGISAAMVRFSTFDVPVGKVPSGGRALTGRRSPSPTSMRAVTRSMKSPWGSEPEPTGTAGRRVEVEVTDVPIGTRCRCASVVSTTATLRSTTSEPRLP